MGLRLDYKKLIADYIEIFYSELEIALKAWETEVRNNLLSDFIKKHGNPQVDSYIKKEKKVLIGYLQANPAVLADSYGTGSLMDFKDNPDYNEYRNSELWNPARNSNTIVGRPAGDYTDIFGNKRHSSGRLEGQELEYRQIRDGYEIRPIPPSNAIKNANNWLFKTYLPIAYNNTLKRIKLSNYVKEVKK